jgi:hypothetical protein
MCLLLQDLSRVLKDTGGLQIALSSPPPSPSSANKTPSHCRHPLAPAAGGAVAAVVAPLKERLEAGGRVHKFS